MSDDGWVVVGTQQPETGESKSVIGGIITHTPGWLGNAGWFEDMVVRDEAGRFADQIGGIGTIARADSPGVTINYLHNTEKAPKVPGMGQDIEPHGRYLIEGEPRPGLDPRWESGSVTFTNPLYLEADGWKERLSEANGGLTGWALSNALLARGIDGIITHDKYGTSEIVDLTVLRPTTQGPLPERTGVPLTNITRIEGHDAYNATVAPGAPRVFRNVGNVAELDAAITAGSWNASGGGFTVKVLEGDTQFTADLAQAQAWSHPMRNEVGDPLIVEADITGLPVRFIGWTEPWKDGTHPANLVGDTYYPSTGTGIGVVGGIPLDRIKNVSMTAPDGTVREFGSWDAFVAWREDPYTKLTQHGEAFVRHDDVATISVLRRSAEADGRTIVVGSRVRGGMYVQLAPLNEAHDGIARGPIAVLERPTVASKLEGVSPAEAAAYLWAINASETTTYVPAHYANNPDPEVARAYLATRRENGLADAERNLARAYRLPPGDKFDGVPQGIADAYRAGTISENDLWHARRDAQYVARADRERAAFAQWVADLKPIADPGPILSLEAADARIGMEQGAGARLSDAHGRSARILASALPEGYTLFFQGRDDEGGESGLANGTTFKGEIMRDGHYVGQFEREFYPETGDVFNKHLDTKYPGLGIGTQWVARSMEAYRAAGYKRVHVRAGLESGGIVWAKAGFLFDVITPDLDSVDSGPGWGQHPLLALEASEDPEVVAWRHLHPVRYTTTPYARANVTITPTPREMHDAGGAVRQLLIGSEWTGIMDLTQTKSGEPTGFAAFLAYIAEHPLGDPEAEEFDARPEQPATPEVKGIGRIARNAIGDITHSLPNRGGWWAGTGFREELVIRDEQGQFSGRVGGIGVPDLPRADVSDSDGSVWREVAQSLLLTGLPGVPSVEEVAYARNTERPNPANPAVRWDRGVSSRLRQEAGADGLWRSRLVTGGEDRPQGERAYLNHTVAVHEPIPAVVAAMAEAEADPVTFLELDHSTDAAAAFADAITTASSHHEFGAAVYVYPTVEYAAMRLFIAPDGSTGFAIKDDGDMVSAFADPDHPAKPRQAVISLMEAGIDNGGTHLDAFDPLLPRLYGQHGFKAVARVSFDPEYAPPNWPAKAGTPDVVFMVLDPAYPHGYAPGDGVRVPDYDAGVATAQRALHPPVAQAPLPPRSKMVPPMPEWYFADQARQYPIHGPEGVSYFKGVIDSQTHIDCLLFYKDGDLVGILNHFPKDFPEAGERKGNITVLVAPEHRRQRIGAALTIEAVKRWDVDLSVQDTTPMGRAFLDAAGTNDLNPFSDGEGVAKYAAMPGTLGWLIEVAARIAGPGDDEPKGPSDPPRVVVPAKDPAPRRPSRFKPLKAGTAPKMSRPYGLGALIGVDPPVRRTRRNLPGGARGYLTLTGGAGLAHGPIVDAEPSVQDISTMPLVLPRSSEGVALTPGTKAILTLAATRRLFPEVDGHDRWHRHVVVTQIGRGAVDVEFTNDPSLGTNDPNLGPFTVTGKDLFAARAGVIPKGYGRNGRQIRVGSIVQMGQGYVAGSDRKGSYGVVLSKGPDADDPTEELWEIRLPDGQVVNKWASTLRVTTTTHKFGHDAKDLRAGDILSWVANDGTLHKDKVLALDTTHDGTVVVSFAPPTKDKPNPNGLILGTPTSLEGPRPETVTLLRFRPHDPVALTRPTARTREELQAVRDKAVAALPSDHVLIGRRKQMFGEDEELVRLSTLRDNQSIRAAEWAAWRDGAHADTLKLIEPAYDLFAEPPANYPWPMTTDDVDVQIKQDTESAAQLDGKVDTYRKWVEGTDPSYVRRGYRWVPDIAADGGPGEGTLKDLRTVNEVGATLLEAVNARYLAKMDFASMSDPDTARARRDVLDEQVTDTYRRENDAREAALLRYALETYGMSDPHTQAHEIPDLEQREKVIVDLFGQTRTEALEKADPELAALMGERKAIYAKVDKINRDMNVAEGIAKAKRMIATREILAEIRPTGGTLPLAHPLTPDVDPLHLPLDEVQVGDKMLTPHGVSTITAIGREGEAPDFFEGVGAADVTMARLASLIDDRTWLLTIEHPNGESTVGRLAAEHASARNATLTVYRGDVPVSENPDPVALKALTMALSMYPTSWVESAAGRGVLTVAPDDGTKRGSFNSQQNTISLPASPEDMMSSAAEIPRLRAATHEVGHLMEESVPGLKAMEWAFHTERTTDRTPTGAVKRENGMRSRTGLNASLPLAILTGQPFYGDEMARGDQYPMPYSGKGYGYGPTAMREMFTTMVESLLAGSAYGDEEMLAWALGVLATL